MNEIESNQLEHRYKRRQRYLMPILIVIVALPVLYWSNQNQARRIDQLQDYMLDIATTIIKGDDPTSRVVADSIAKRDGFIETMGAILEEHDDPSQVQVVATEGDDSPFADGRATHTVRIAIDRTPALEVRIAWPEKGAIVILGYQYPASADDESDSPG
ncbi:MAG: hypothetical protein O7G85_07325 [Planctomycetota bacterium]|nr:hypothetical protein [Planctomycetota bacterium]